MKKFIDLTGKKFNRLTVIKYIGQSKWLCKCDCGNETTVYYKYLITGHTKSCGCLRKNNNLKHNLCEHRLYNIWHAMKNRCKFDKRYINKNIKIYKKWINNFKCFYNWSIKNGYNDNLSLDRINNNGNYTPYNCRWATQKEQCRNKDNNILITFNKKTKCLAEWAEILNIKDSKLKSLLSKYNIEQIFNNINAVSEQ